MQRLPNFVSLFSAHNLVYRHLALIDTWSDGVDPNPNALQGKLSGHHLREVTRGGFTGIVAKLEDKYQQIIHMV